jgi:hypothetical protein
MTITRTITIEIQGDGGRDGYTVREADRYCPNLCWDEMLGTISELTHPRISTCRYRMGTPEEHHAKHRRHQERMAELRSHGEAERLRAEREAAELEMLRSLFKALVIGESVRQPRTADKEAA